MQRTQIVSLVSLALLPATVAAAQQQVVSPAAWTDIDAPSANAFPFGSRAVPFRYLNVHDDLVGTTRTILAMAFRRSGTTSTSVVGPTSTVLDGWMSTATTTGATVDATFDNNHGADKTQVLTRATINFPDAPTGLLPYPFLHRMPLAVPFVHVGSGPLCWELQITARPATSSVLFHDYVAGAGSNPNMVVSRFGSGCVASGNSDPFALTGAGSSDWSSSRMASFSATASDGPPSAAAALLVGTSARSWNGLPLPLLLPGTSGSASGACFVNNDVAVSVPATLSGSGGNTFRLQAPLNLSLNGFDLLSQALAVDVGANALGLITSNSVDHQVLAPHAAAPGGRVYASSLAAIGTRGANQSLVVQFEFN